MGSYASRRPTHHLPIASRRLRLFEGTFGAFVFVLIASIFGYPYGETGDPQRYAEDFNRGCDFAGGQAIEPLFCGVIYVSSALNDFFEIGAFEISVLTSLQIGLAFFLLCNNLGKTFLSLGLFVLTMQGFLVTFNLYRSSLAILCFSIAYCFYLRILPASWKKQFLFANLFAGLAHMSFFIVAASASRFIFFVLIMIVGIFLYSPDSFSLFGKSLFYYDKLTASYVEEPATFPFSFFLNVALWILLRRLKWIPAIRDWLTPLGVLVLIQFFCIALVQPLMYERVSVVFLFFAISQIVISRCYLLSKGLVLLAAIYAILSLPQFLSLQRLAAA